MSIISNKINNNNRILNLQINSSLNDKSILTDEESTPKAEIQQKAENFKNILGDKLEAVVELINESINNNNTLENNLLEFRKNQLTFSPRLVNYICYRKK